MTLTEENADELHSRSALFFSAATAAVIHHCQTVYNNFTNLIILSSAKVGIIT